MDDGDRKLFAESLRYATEQHTGAALDAALDKLGWRDALEDDRRDAVSIFFELQGAANVTSSALDDLMATGLGLGVGTAPSLDATTGVILPRIGQQDPPGRVVGTRLRIHGVATQSLQRHTSATIVYGDGPYVASYVATVTWAQLDLRPVPGIDPALGLVEVRADIPFRGDPDPVAAPWDAAVADGQVALAHELVGVSRTMLRLARDHAVERVQFGRPIAGFQAIRHRLAESLVAIEAAQASTEAAWDDASPLAAALAKAIAGSSARTVARHAQQVLGGMGYTTEHPLHRYVRRTLVLDQLLGSGRSLTREIGEQLLRNRQLPDMLQL